ncbi:MAG: hypothetical protein ABIJ61_04250 [bacterium]
MRKARWIAITTIAVCVCVVATIDAARHGVNTPENITLNGHGQQASPKFQLLDGLSVFDMKHVGSSNFSVVLLDSDGEYVELLANEIGHFDGSKPVSIPAKGTYILDIDADGPWEIEIKQPRLSRAPDTKEFAGRGQQCSKIFQLKRGLSVFKMSHSGRSNFAVVLMDADGQHIELLANEIGRFSGSKAVGIPRSDLYIMDVMADGDWSIHIE